jgi:hypothetical protein
VIVPDHRYDPAVTQSGHGYCRACGLRDDDHPLDRSIVLCEDALCPMADVYNEWKFHSLYEHYHSCGQWPYLDVSGECSSCTETEHRA